jgi:hypothetical protein
LAENLWSSGKGRRLMTLRPWVLNSNPKLCGKWHCFCNPAKGRVEFEDG